MISSLALKCQDSEVGISFFKPFYVMKLKTSKLKVLAFCCQWRYRYQIQITSGFPSSTFTPCRTWAFYIVKRQNCVIICDTVYYWEQNMNTRSEYDDLTRFHCSATVRFYFGMSKILLTRKSSKFRKIKFVFSRWDYVKIFRDIWGACKCFL